MPDLHYTPAPDESEEWRPVPGYEGFYSVSSLGRVRRDKPEHGTQAGRILKPHLDRAGYLTLHLYKNTVCKGWFLHHLVAAAFLPPPPVFPPAEGRPEINHKDGKPLNNAAHNLEWTSLLGNHRHASASGLTARGEAVGSARLCAKQVRAIRAEYARGGVSQQKLAAQHCVSQTTVGKIVRRKTWRHI